MNMWEINVSWWEPGATFMMTMMMTAIIFVIMEMKADERYSVQMKESEYCH
jgi:hypothetical protein